MSDPIYKLWMAKPKEAWYQLSDEEQNALMEKDRQSLESLEVENIVACNAYWASEEWLFFGVQKYPNLEAVQQHAQNQAAVDWFRYIEARTLLGTESEYN